MLILHKRLFDRTLVYQSVPGRRDVRTIRQLCRRFQVLLLLIVGLVSPFCSPKLELLLQTSELTLYSAWPCQNILHQYSFIHRTYTVRVAAKSSYNQITYNDNEQIQKRIAKL